MEESYFWIWRVILGTLIPGYSFIVFRISNPRSFIESFIDSFEI